MPIKYHQNTDIVCVVKRTSFWLECSFKGDKSNRKKEETTINACDIHVPS